MKKKKLYVVFAAYLLAEKAHRGTMRRGKDEPYLNHPVAVSMKIAKYAGKEYYDANTLAAAILHDAWEDEGATLEEIVESTNEDVARLVQQVSKVSKSSDGNRATRQQIDLDHYAAGEARAQTIKVADVDDNSWDVVEADLKFAQRYLPEQRAKLDVLTKACPKLRAKAYKTLDKAEKRLKERLQST